MTWLVGLIAAIVEALAKAFLAPNPAKEAYQRGIAEQKAADSDASLAEASKAMAARDASLAASAAAPDHVRDADPNSRD